jgi:hypothetical protein
MVKFLRISRSGVPLSHNLSLSADVPRDKQDQCWVQELVSAAKRFQSNFRWQTEFRKTAERLGKDHQRTLETELAMAQSEDPERFLILLLTLTDWHYLTRRGGSLVPGHQMGANHSHSVSERIRHLLSALFAERRAETEGGFPLWGDAYSWSLRARGTGSSSQPCRSRPNSWS